MIPSHNGGWAQQQFLTQWKLYTQNWVQLIIEIVTKSHEQVAHISLSFIPAALSLFFFNVVIWPYGRFLIAN